MDAAWLEANSANNRAENQVGFGPQNPYLPGMPETPEYVSPIGLTIGTFDTGGKK